MPYFSALHDYNSRCASKPQTIIIIFSTIILIFIGIYSKRVGLTTNYFEWAFNSYSLLYSLWKISNWNYHWLILCLYCIDTELKCNCVHVINFNLIFLYSLLCINTKCIHNVTIIIRIWFTPAAEGLNIWTTVSKRRSLFSCNSL